MSEINTMCLIEATAILPEGIYFLDDTQTRSTGRIAPRDVRPFLPDGFDLLPGSTGELRNRHGRTWWYLRGCCYPTSVVLAVLAGHPGTTWTTGRRQKGGIVPAIGVLDRRVVAVVMSKVGLNDRVIPITRDPIGAWAEHVVRCGEALMAAAGSPTTSADTGALSPAAKIDGVLERILKDLRASACAADRADDVSYYQGLTYAIAAVEDELRRAP